MLLISFPGRSSSFTVVLTRPAFSRAPIIDDIAIVGILSFALILPIVASLLPVRKDLPTRNMIFSAMRSRTVLDKRGSWRPVRRNAGRWW